MDLFTLAFLGGRVAFGGYFVMAGINHFSQWKTMSGLAAAHGLPAPRVAVLASGALLADATPGTSEDLAAAWAEGQALTVEQAVDYALDQNPWPSTLTSPRAGDAAGTTRMNAAHTTARANLTRRERDVLRLVSEGRSNRAIAEVLAIEVGTVKRHLHSLLGKLEAHSRTEALARARALGLL